jgi:uncharacterized protein (DUF983 family)
MRIIRALIDGLITRCPQCHQGKLFERGFQMHPHCLQCGFIYQQATGEITGGMGINIGVTLIPLMIAAFVLGVNPDLPLGPVLLSLAAFAIVFPIAFYRSARGLWVAITYLTGDTREAD